MHCAVVYFKTTGKFYTNDEFDVECTDVTLRQTVEYMFSDGKRPGLMERCGGEFFAVVTPIEENGETGVPFMILPTWLQAVREAFS